MSDHCEQNCGSCSDECSDRKESPKADANSFLEAPHPQSHIKKVIGVVSGKGGVGKSLVTSLLAVSMQRLGYSVGILDADITGPSIPRAFGVSKKAVADEAGLLPGTSKTGIKIMSLNLLLENTTDPVVWRGPIIAGTVKQFWTDVVWGNLDYLFIDMPPGTGDVPLTVFQTIPVDGIVVVTSPQELVSMIVAKAVKMAQMMHIPILGLVENMSYFHCPDNGKNYPVFGESHIDTIATEYKVPVLAKLPIDPKLAAACDTGMIELFDGNWIDNITTLLDTMEEETMKRIAVASDNGMVTEHFGHCEGFVLFDTRDGKIVKEVTIANPGHKPGFLPNYLNDQGVNTIISGGMGGGAIDIFNEKNIEVIVGATGTAKDAAEKYLAGNLKSTGSVCNEHAHHEECGQ